MGVDLFANRSDHKAHHANASINSTALYRGAPDSRLFLRIRMRKKLYKPISIEMKCQRYFKQSQLFFSLPLFSEKHLVWIWIQTWTTMDPDSKTGMFESGYFGNQCFLYQ